MGFLEMHLSFRTVTLAAALGLAACASDPEETLTPARLVGTKSVEPFPGPLADPLIIYVDDSISGAVLTVPLESTTSSAGIIDAVNVITSGRVVASLSEGHLALTTVEAGPDVFLSVYNTTSSDALGLSQLPLTRGARTVE